MQWTPSSPDVNKKSTVNCEDEIILFATNNLTANQQLNY